MKLNYTLTHTLLLSLALVGTAKAQVVSGASYRILSACDQTKALAAANNSVANSARIVLQSMSSSSSSQVFNFQLSDAGYLVKGQSSGKYFNIVNGSKASKARLEQYAATGSSAQLFKVSTTSDGFVRLQNVNSGYYLNLLEGKTAVGTPVEQYLSTTYCAERFKLVAISSPAPSPSPTPVLPPPPAPTPTPVPPTGSSRDPLKQPFASNSIWNMPIGSAAVYKPANLSGNPANNIWATMPGADEEHLFFTPTAPLTAINYSSVGWSGGNRCGATGGLLVSVPMPSNYVIPNNNGNTAGVFLMPDGRSLVQTQPMARCTAGGPATALVKFAAVDLYGPGITGAHGGSGLSSIGGSIRVGELRPGSQGPKHALKVNLYAKEALFRCSVRSDCFRWPATTADSYAIGFYGTANNNSNADMKMGALLAIPASTLIASLGLETEPARQLAWTLQNYGAYVVDDTYAAGFAFSTETGPSGSKVQEFEKDFGFAFVQKVNSQSTSPWVRDTQRLVKALHVVSNNSANSIGGGGTPRQPLAAPIAP